MSLAGTTVGGATRLPVHPPLTLLLRALGCGLGLAVALGAEMDDGTPPWLLDAVALWCGLGLPWVALLWARAWIDIDAQRIAWVRPRLFNPLAAGQELPRRRLRRVVVVETGRKLRVAYIELDLDDGSRARLSAMEVNLFRFQVTDHAKRLAALLGLPCVEGEAVYSTIRSH